MVIDLTGNSNLDQSLLGFDASKIVTNLKKDIGLFDMTRPLSEAKEELDNLMQSRAELNSKVIDAIKANDKNALKLASKNLQLLNKSIYLIQSEVDYKTKIDFIKANSMAKAPVSENSKEEVEAAKDKVEEMEETAKEEKDLTKLVTDIQASTGDVVAKAKSKISSFIENPKEYFTAKNVLTVSFVGLAVYGLYKFIK